MFCSPEIVQRMYDLGARGHVAYWSTRGGNEFIVFEGDHTDGQGNSAIHYAAQHDLLDSLKAIHQQQGHLEILKRNKAGLTPLTIAIDSISYRAAIFLMSVTQVSQLQPHELEIIENCMSPYLKAEFNRHKDI
jgi:hypothetical protein